MTMEILWGLFIPFIGTAIGSASVLFMKRGFNANIQKIFSGFAAGIMVAASVWSLIIPSIESSSHMGKLSFLPATLGYIFGIIFLLLSDRKITEMSGKSAFGKNTMMILAVTLHNIPEGMAVGVSFAGALFGKSEALFAAAMTLSIGIAIQNIPEGAIISLPLSADGKSKPKSFGYGVLSGAVEPIAGALTLLFAGLVASVLPYLLSFAAGAMMFVVVEELIPEISGQTDSKIGILSFSAGFIVMMALDVALG